ncbi:MAG: 4-(cytidine 5'-diphospho)-2-C-methyl-D-erythritol kinase [Planctomycetaceae bacterium]
MLFSQLDSSLVVHAPAKLNLFLEILGRRGDGYHEIETVMVTVGLHDTLAFADDDSGAIRLTIHDASADPAAGSSPGHRPLPADSRNLVVRAAELLRAETGTSRGARITLMKRIPAEAGLAGGSSDAAATLAALDRLWNLGLSRNDLMELASRLGSDVPFFFVPSGVAVARGRGERLEPLASPAALHFVIVRPPSGLSTAEVYRHCRPAERPRDAGPLIDALRAGRAERVARGIHNALRSPAESLNADVRRLGDWFDRQPVLGHGMSGSGTAYYGLCATRTQARTLAGRLRAARLGRAFVARSGSSRSLDSTREGERAWTSPKSASS